MMESDREQGCPARSPMWTHTGVPCPTPPTAFVHPMARGHAGWWERTGDPPEKPVHGEDSRTPRLNPKTDLVLHQGLKDTTIQRAPVQLVPRTRSQQRPSRNRYPLRRHHVVQKGDWPPAARALLGGSLALSFSPETRKVWSSSPSVARWGADAPQSRESKGDDAWTATADRLSAHWITRVETLQRRPVETLLGPPVSTRSPPSIHRHLPELSPGCL